MDLNRNQQITNNTLAITGVFNFADIDKFEFTDLELAKRTFLFSMSDMTYEQAESELKGVLSQMKITLEDYFPRTMIESYGYVDDDGTKSNFYQVKDSVGDIRTKDFLLAVCEIAFTQYKHFMKRIYSAPVEIKNEKKKLSHGSSQSSTQHTTALKTSKRFI